MGVLDVANKDCLECVAAMQFLINEKSKVLKSASNHFRYVKARIVGKMHTGGYGKTFAKKLVGRLENFQAEVEPDTSAFDKAAVQHWAGQRDHGKTLLKRMSAAREKITNMGDRQELLAETMSNKPDF